MPFPTTLKPLARALAERNYDEPTPVQAEVLKAATDDRDLLVSAQTGSGKTIAYGLAIARTLLGDRDLFQKGSVPAALIVAPTRELALQVQRELTWLYQYTGARVVSCVGGMDPRGEQRELAAGADIVVGTPGRLCDHLRRRRLDVSALKAVVLDEADEMLDLGFREDLEFILETTPAERRTLLFSATLPRTIVGLARQYQKDAQRIEVAGGEGGHADIDYRAIRIAPGDVEHAVVNILRYFEAPGAIVFCNTRSAVAHLQTALLERGFSVVALSGELTQNERSHALQALRDGRARVCVATDVAARGIDLPNLGLVIHADLPHDPEVLQHRSGRTGRAGRKGVSVMLVIPARRRRAEIMLNTAGIDAQWGLAPTADEIRTLDQQRMLQDPLITEQANEDDLVLARALLAERSAEDIAAALARFYWSRLPAPEEILDPGPAGRAPLARSARNDRLAQRERPAQHERQAADAPERPRHGAGPDGGVWFRASVGRKANAEARWLLPMICRRGGINKRDVGAIRIFPTYTDFQISADAAEQFGVMIQLPDKEDRSIAISVLPRSPETDAYSDAGPHKPRFKGKPFRAPADAASEGMAPQQAGRPEGEGGEHDRPSPPGKPFQPGKRRKPKGMIFDAPHDAVRAAAPAGRAFAKKRKP